MKNASLLVKLKDQLLDLHTPAVMGIVNVSPDSFFAGSVLKSSRLMLQQVEKHIKEGASIIDVGGYSTRPNAEHVTFEEELSRLVNALELITKHFPDVLISVDTFRSAIAQRVVEQFGVVMINDVGGGDLDPKMHETVADLGVAYVLMHSRGTPQTMQTLTDYNHVVADILHVFSKKVAQLRLLGVTDVLVDVGFGFAKSLKQNYQLLAGLSIFQQLEVPIVVGLSRKSMIYQLLQCAPEDALNGTTAAHMLALFGGASMLRVHDVAPAKEAIRIFEMYSNTSINKQNVWDLK